MLMKSQNLHRESIYMRLCRYTVRINRIDDSGNTIAHKRKIGRAEVKAMRFQGGEGRQCGADPGRNCSSASASPGVGIP